jgi:hypothetical protein
VSESSDQVHRDTGAWISGPCLDADHLMPATWTTEDSSLLLELQSIWAGKYTVKVDRDGIWTAQRQGSAAPAITADTGQQIRPLITGDAIAWNREIFGGEKS